MLTSVYISVQFAWRGYLFSVSGWHLPRAKNTLLAALLPSPRDTALHCRMLLMALEADVLIGTAWRHKSPSHSWGCPHPLYKIFNKLCIVFSYMMAILHACIAEESRKLCTYYTKILQSEQRKAGNRVHIILKEYYRDEESRKLCAYYTKTWAGIICSK